MRNKPGCLRCNRNPCLSASRVKLIPCVINRDASAAIGIRACLLDRAGRVSIDAHPEGRVMRSGTAFGFGHNPGTFGLGEGGPGHGVTAPVATGDRAVSVSKRSRIGRCRRGAVFSVVSDGGGALETCANAGSMAIA